MMMMMMMMMMIESVAVHDALIIEMMAMHDVLLCNACRRKAMVATQLVIIWRWAWYTESASVWHVSRWASRSIVLPQQERIQHVALAGTSVRMALLVTRARSLG